MPPSAHQRFRLIGLSNENRRAEFGRAVAAGLTETPKRLPCCYFYDRLGSVLFEAICELPEYYLTRAETAILQNHADEIAAHFPNEVDLIELGSGNASKTRLLLDAFTRRHAAQRYVPIDICRTVLEESSLALTRDYSNLEVLAIAAEYHEGLAQLRSVSTRPRLLLWLGSNIGNLERAAATAFVRQLRELSAPGDRLLLGVDLRKDAATLEAAYDDPCGVTAAFNRNLLVRINRELGGTFDVRAFRHRAVYATEPGRVEMHLISERAQRVAIARLGIEIAFAAGETIHTENCYKYSRAELDALAVAAGLRTERSWTDPEGRFLLTMLAVDGR
jgi:dimethylhistidine N-methyltransferase